MNVKNRKAIRHLSFKTLLASGKRNLIAIMAIILTTLMFTSLFTIILCINASYQTYQFRQIGGYAHGSFKDITDEQAEKIAAHPKVKEAGARKAIGIITDGVFAKLPAEVSFMDENCTKWSYAVPTTGKMPESGNEISMDTKSLELLGVTAELGSEITLTYAFMNGGPESNTVTDTFVLVGYWEYDDVMPVHYINVSEEYAESAAKQAQALGLEELRTDLNVMMASGINIRGQMEQVDRDLGYDPEDRTAENSARIGVNWGYTAAQIGELLDIGNIFAFAAFILLVVFTGYLIIYNIFQISVAGDIRYYGLLKTIGVTPRQLRRIIRLQALFLCIIGIPAGMALGYGIGLVITPLVLESATTYGATAFTMSTSPWIFLFSAAFSLVTVLLSCYRPGRLAAKVSPVEAVRYTDNVRTKKKSRATRGAKVAQMAFANLGRNKSKTVLVMLSLSLSVILLNLLCSFVGSFDMDRYLGQQVCADFVVSSPDYFRYAMGVDEYISEESIAGIQANTEETTAGCGYLPLGYTEIWMKEAAWRAGASGFFSEETMDEALTSRDRMGDMVRESAQLEGLDETLLQKLTVLDGDIEPLYQAGSRSVAIEAELDDYGNLANPDLYPSVGDTITVTYADGARYVDSRTGEAIDEKTPQEYIKEELQNVHEVEYTVCALVSVPYTMSYRYGEMGYTAVLPVETLKQDSGQEVIPMFYLFDTPDEEAEAQAEAYLSDLTGSDLSELMYESKATLRTEFAQFRNMFLLVGGLLCAVIAVVGILNFFNAVMTGILSRRKEFAVLQAVGMTAGQLKKMLVYEGMFYAVGAAAAAVIVSAVLEPLISGFLENIIWFFSAHFNIIPALLALPVFALMGWAIPAALDGQVRKHSVVERLRESE